MPFLAIYGQVKMEKLEIMIKLASDRNVDQVLMELKEYSTEVSSPGLSALPSHAHLPPPPHVFSFVGFETGA